LIYGAAGIGLLLPDAAFPEARWFNIAGAVISVALFFWERSKRREVQSAGTAVPVTAEASAAGGAPLAGDQQRVFLDRMGVRGTGEGE
jgi:hypothetical protein